MCLHLLGVSLLRRWNYYTLHIHIMYVYTCTWTVYIFTIIYVLSLGKGTYNTFPRKKNIIELSWNFLHPWLLEQVYISVLLNTILDLHYHPRAKLLQSRRVQFHAYVHRSQLLATCNTFSWVTMATIGISAQCASKLKSDLWCVRAFSFLFTTHDLNMQWRRG